MGSKRSAAVTLLAVTLATAALPAHSHARRISAHVTRDVHHDASNAAAIGLGITAGVVALVGGAVWYFVHRRRQAAAPPAPPVSSEGTVPIPSS